jgi:glycosyltransferase involved in cell wall biosynthesis
MQPLVSVIIPTFNRAHCIADAVRSASRQSSFDPRNDIEIVVVDDCSTDNTVEVLGGLQKSIHNIRIIRHEKNYGVSAARNTGIDAARGKIIAFLDSDDVWSQHKLIWQIMDLVAPGQNIGKTFSLTYFENVRDGKYSINNVFLSDETRAKDGNLKNLRHYNQCEIERGIVTWKLWFGIGSTLVAHRLAIKRNGYFNENFGHGEDTEYVVRHLVADGVVTVVPQILMAYLTPEAGKTYPGKGVFSSYMIEHYRCAIAERWGAGTARSFVHSMWTSARATNPLHGHWKKTAPLLTISAGAPCRDDAYNCALRGSLCQKRLG